MASPERDKEGFTLVDRKRQKKRKAEHSPLLHTPPGSSSASTSGTPTVPKPSNFNYPNTVPVIFRDADPNFTSICSVVPLEKATWSTYMEQCVVATAQVRET